MSESTLDPDNIPAGNDRSLGKGHGTGALGPSDTSDSGSDVQGGAPGHRAGPELGDPELESDSDSGGTGERGEVGFDTVQSGADIDTDHTETIPEEEEELVDAGMKEGDVERAAADRAGQDQARPTAPPSSRP
jgi:hypothetical protein